MRASVGNDIVRDSWGRPLVEVPGGGEVLPYVRASSVGGMVEYRGGLEEWKQRVVAHGMGVSPHLGSAASLLEIGDGDSKKKLDAIVRQAFDVGGGNVAAENGTMVHEVVERLVTGRSVPKSMPGPVRETAEAVLRCMGGVGVRPLLIETFLVYDARGFGCRQDAKRPTGGIAGSADMICQVSGGGAVVTDVKTGSQLSAVSILAQLAVYAKGGRPLEGGGRDYLFGGGELEQRYAIVWHAPFGVGRCDAVRVDLAGGMEVFRAAHAVGAVRKIRDKDVFSV